ncbi:MAG: hypothetical protein RLZZ350_868 [Verrucomicrobiota bacterium]|jgi:hypothetical protein
MKKLFPFAFLISFVALSWLAWNLFFPSPEKICLRQMAALAQTATFGEQTNPLTRAAKAQSLLGQFTADAQLDFEIAGIGARHFAGRDEIQDACTGAFAGLRLLRVQFLDATAQVAPDQQTVTVSCTAKVFVNDTKDFGVSEMRFQWRKTKDGWRISKAETVQTLT